jgi:hypothetical protein
MNRGEACSFLTIPNAFKPCTSTLLLIHSAIYKGLKEKLPDPSINQSIADHDV